MRFSIVFDDNGANLCASEGDDVTDRPAPGPGENIADFDIPNDPSGAGLQEAIERVLVDVDATRLGPRTAQKSAEDGPNLNPHSVSGPHVISNNKH